MLNQKLSAKEAMELMEELNRYPVGSIYFSNRDKKYSISFYYDSLEGEVGKRKTYTRKSKEELIPLRTKFLTELYYEKLALRKQRENIEVLKSVLPERLLKEDIKCEKTVNEAVDGYLAFHKQRVKFKTHESEKFYAKHVKKWLGDKKVCDLKGIDFQYLLNNVAQGKDGKRASEKTVKAVKGCYSRTIEFCKNNGWITLNEMHELLDKVSMPMTARKDKNAKYLPMEEMGAVLNALKDNRRYYLIVKILLLTGMRGQEIFALEKCDLLSHKEMLNIRQALEEREKKTLHDRKYVLGDTKNEESERYAPAIKEVFNCFRELEEMQVEKGWRQKAYEHGNGNLAIIDSNGQIVDKTAFNRNLGLYLERRGFKKKLTLHMPRHCYTTYLKLLGADVENVEFSLGHTINGVRGEYLADLTPDYVKLLIPKIKEMSEHIRKKEELAG